MSMLERKKKSECSTVYCVWIERVFTIPIDDKNKMLINGIDSEEEKNGSVPFWWYEIREIIRTSVLSLQVNRKQCRQLRKKEGKTWRNSPITYK